MPINRRYPLSVLLDACRRYVDMTDRRIFFEYVLLKGQNDSAGHARKLGGLLEGMLCHVNLIPVNPTSEGPYERTSRKDAETFQKMLRRYGVASTVRMEKGNRHRCRLWTAEGAGGGCGCVGGRIADDRNSSIRRHRATYVTSVLAARSKCAKGAFLTIHPRSPQSNHGLSRYTIRFYRLIECVSRDLFTFFVNSLS